MLKPIPLPRSGLTLSSMALGASAFGPQLSAAAIDRLYDLYRQAGGNCFDTAHCYSFWLPAGAGSAERALGACIGRHGDRQNVCIITKGGHPVVLPDYPRPDAYLAPEVLAQDIAESLERLATPTIDLYLLHRDDPRVPVGEIVDALNVHISAGRLRAIGVSNWPTERIAQANAYAEARCLHGFVASEPQFNLGQFNPLPSPTDPPPRYLDAADRAWHIQTGLPALCYAPTANGYFASAGHRARQAFENSTSRARLARAQQLAAELCATPSQIALAYVLGQPFPAIPILGTGDPAHLADALAAADVVLSPSQVQWLRDGEATKP